MAAVVLVAYPRAGEGDLVLAAPVEQVEVDELSKNLPKLFLRRPIELESVPDDVLVICLSFLDPLSLIRCARVNRQLRRFFHKIF